MKTINYLIETTLTVENKINVSTVDVIFML